MGWLKVVNGFWEFLFYNRVSIGEVPERPNGTVSKTVVGSAHRGFESPPSPLRVRSLPSTTSLLALDLSKNGG